MSKIIVNTEVMGPDFSELVLHELNYEWSREVVTLAASEADLPFGMVLMREAGEYKPLTESTVESAQKLGGAPVAVLIGVVFMERAQRRIPIQYAKRQVGLKMYGGQSTHLPLRVNTAGVIPPIFASSLLLFPATMANFDIADWLKTAASWFTPSSILYNVIFIALIFFFCFFYTAIIFDPKDVAENLKKAGGFIPGIRPGEKTQEYLDAVLSRLTLWGGVYISVISVLPMLLIAEFNVPFYFGGTSILILVGVAMDFMSQIESHLISRQYEGLMGKTRIKGRS